ncbi:MAG: ABC transporter substrate-binding protein, partial [Pseudomonas sp.]
MARLLRLLLLCLWPLGPLSAGEILLVGGEDQPGIRSFVAAFESHRPHDQVRFQTTADLPRPSRLKADQRLVLLDSAALEWRLSESAGPPALAMRVSRVQAEQRLGKSRPAFLTLLWSDPPLARQLRLARYLLPQAQRIGVLYGTHRGFLLEELRHAARPLGLEIIAQDWPDLRDSRPLQHLLGNSDVLLGLDDPDLYNSKTAKNLLLSSYARQMALIGPNAGFVRAGALASTY